MAAPFGAMELLVLLMFGGGAINLPVGLPPLPEDAKLAQVAPEQVLAYLTWAGTADADPKSGNSAERILAEPQVKYLIKRIEDGILAALNREAAQEGGEMKALVKHGHLLIKQALLRPTALYISKLDITRDVPAIEAGLVINFGKDAPAAKAALEAIEGMIAQEIGPFQVMPANQGGLRRVPVPDDEAPLMAWGFEGDYLIIAVGPESAGRIRGALLNGKAPAWLTGIKEKIALKRSSSLTYINAPAVLKQFGPLLAAEMGGGPEGQQMFDRVMAALGVNKVTALAAATGFDDTKFVSRSLIALDGNPGGLFKLISGTGLTVKDLADVPADADLAFVAKLNPAEIFDEFVKIMGEIEPDARDMMFEGMQEAEQELGFRIKQDLFDSVGDVWSIYNSPGDGGLVITGLTGVVQVKDRAKAQKAIDGLERAFSQEFNRGNDDPNNPRRRRYEIKTVEHEGQKIRFINAIGDDWVVAPAWCLTKDRFIIAPYPQMVKSYLSRAASTPAGKTLADVASVKPLFAAGSSAAPPAMVSYIDTPELFKKFYPLAHGMATLICSQIQREGIDIDVSALPTASSILPHLTPDTGSVRRTADGILAENRQSLPVAGLGTLLPTLFWVGVAESRMIGHEHARPGIQVAPVPFDEIAPPCGAKEHVEAEERTRDANRIMRRVLERLTR